MNLVADAMHKKICLAGTWDSKFHRNVTLQRCLGLAGYDVDSCRVELWGERGDTVVRKRKLQIILRAFVAYPLLVWRFLRAPRPDVVLVPYPGHFDVPLLALLCRIRGLPLIFDTFISLFDTIVADRQLATAWSPVGLIGRLADRLACRFPDMCLVDTPSHARYFATSTGVPEERFRVLWLGAQEDIFRPQPEVDVDPSLVLFHGTFVRLQGLETIVRAAAMLQAEDIKFRIIGDGQERTRIDRLTLGLGVKNIEMPGLIPLATVPREIASSAICLGIFGTTQKASRVVPNKVFECLAVGRPVITGDTPAIRSAFSDREVFRVPVGDPEELARAIRKLMRNPSLREEFAVAGHERFRRDYCEGALARLLRGHIEEVFTPNALSR